ncbi:hypothetical protein PGTUg99_007547 [Puccinia graminis f. sp. tritici]|uniref:Uncharacterized protein n=1 Tax=Puccinia graminis f. sp. tritici TaxID=56615 RepID=A0A5B0PWF6_PUCGR|nr:hypothetical protein PGTUg99_007547 [Puccinia graminis f. sp. tritici]
MTAHLEPIFLSSPGRESLEEFYKLVIRLLIRNRLAKQGHADVRHRRACSSQREPAKMPLFLFSRLTVMISSHWSAVCRNGASWLARRKEEIPPIRIHHQPSFLSSLAVQIPIPGQIDRDTHTSKYTAPQRDHTCSRLGAALTH